MGNESDCICYPMSRRWTARPLLLTALQRENCLHMDPFLQSGIFTSGGGNGKPGR